MTVTTAHESEGVVVPPPVPAAAATGTATPVADVIETKSSDETNVIVADEKHPEADPDMQKMIAEAQKAADDHAVETPPSQDVDFSGLLAKLDGKADAPRHETPRNPKGNRKFGFGGGRRHHNNDRDDRHDDRRVENVVAAPVVAPVSNPTPAVVHDVVVPEVKKTEAVTPKSTPVEPVVEDVEIADLRRRARPVFDEHRADMAKLNADANKWKKFGPYVAAAALVLLVGSGYGLMKAFGGGDVAREVPHVPVIAATPAPTTPPAATAADVLGEKFDKLNHRLDETMPTSADLALLDSKITEAENAAIAQIAHVPCFKDPDQPRCRKAVNTERDYFESDFSHPRDVALGKIPYTPPTNKVDKPAKKAGKKTKK